MKNFTLLFIIILGFILRSYQLNFPSIGYHNMKENENLSIAEEMIRTKDFLNKRVYFINAFDDNPIANSLYLQLPLVPYQIIFCWKLLGKNLWGARLLNILFGLGSILLIYFISRLLFKRISLALFSAFLLATLPLGVFFSRNLQAESPALFFMLLGIFFYLIFCYSYKKKYLFFGGLSFSISWLYQFNFLIGVVPFFLCFSFETLFKNKKEFFNFCLVWFISFIPLLAGLIFIRYLNGIGIFTLKSNIFDIFLPSYWQKHGRAIFWYIKEENFTFFYALLTILGIFLASLRNKELVEKFISGWLFALIVYGMLFSNELAQNNFSQMPFLILVCIASTYTVDFIFQEIRSFLKRDILLYILCFLCIFSFPSFYKRIWYLYQTVFYGIDVAGETLKEFTKPNERVFLFTHAQGYGIARYAQRYMGWVSNLEEFKEKEEKFKIKFVCIYPLELFTELKKNFFEIFSYIDNNYEIREIGLTETPKRIFYLILGKGKTQPKKIEEVLNSIYGEITPRSIYKIRGNIIFFYTIRFKNKNG